MKCRMKKLLQRKSLAVFLAITLITSTLASNLLQYETGNAEENLVDDTDTNEAHLLVDEKVYDIRYEAQDIMNWLGESDLNTAISLEEWFDLIPFQEEKSFEEFRIRFASSKLYILKANLTEHNTQLLEGCNSYVLYEVDGAGNEYIIFLLINQTEIARKFKIMIPGLDTTNMEVFCYQEVSTKVEEDPLVATGGAITITTVPEEEAGGEVVTAILEEEVGGGAVTAIPEEESCGLVATGSSIGVDLLEEENNVQLPEEEVVEPEYKLEVSTTQGESEIGEKGVAYASISLKLIESLVQTGIKYLNANLYDYDETPLNTAIGLNTAGGYHNDRFYVGETKAGKQNTWTGSGNGVAQGIVNDTLTDNKDLIKFSTNGINFFPTATGSGITAYLNYEFPLKEITDGYYEFNSEKNHVYIGDTISGTKKLLLKDGKQSVKTGSSTHTSFFPFNASNNTEANHLFSMELSGDFYYPKDGKVNGMDMIFEFSGDDDVWLYIKDNSQANNNYKLALDLGGIHDTSSGRINFSTGLITVDKVAVVYQNSSWVSKGNQKSYWYLYDSETFTEMKSAGAIDSSVTIESGKYLGFTRDDFTQYSFKLFYMERGKYASNCYIKLNFPLIQTNKVTVVKEVENLQDEYKDKIYEFNLFTSGNKDELTDEYLSDSNVKQTINLRAGESGTFDVATGEYYRIKEITSPEDIFTTRWGHNINGVMQPSVGGTITTVLSQEETDRVEFYNTYPLKGTLTITKSVTVDYERDFTSPSDAKYDFILEITDIPEGEGKDIVHGTSRAGDKTVTIEKNATSILFTLKNNESYVVENIPDGCSYKVIEVMDMGILNHYYDHQVQVAIDGVPTDVVNMVIEQYEKFKSKPGVYVSGKFITEKDTENETEKEDVPTNIQIEFTNDFKLLKGNIVVVKSLKDSSNPRFYDHEDNTFIFTLRNIDEDSPGYGLEYQREVHIKKGNLFGYSIFHDLPMGTYEIKEIDHMRYSLTSPQTELTTIVLRKDSKEYYEKYYDDEIKIDFPYPYCVVYYHNSKIQEGYFSDTNVAVNVVNKQSEVTTFKKYIYINGEKKYGFNSERWSFDFEVPYMKEDENEV